MIKSRLSIIVCILLAGVLISCGSSKKEDAEAYLETLDEEESEEQLPTISEDIVRDLLQQIPSPIEMSVLIKETGLAYDPSMLSDAEKSGNYSTAFKQSVNLGIYGSDMIYTNIFEQSNDGIEYLVSVKELSDQLNIGQFFDMNLIQQLATNSDNLDSLLLITTQNFNEINKYLQEQNRSNLSVLFLVGGWLEGLHINAQIARAFPDQKSLVDRIGEQKVILENVYLLLDFFSGQDRNIADLKSKIEDLRKVYDKVEITYEYAEPTYEVVDGVLMIQDNSRSIINITQDNIIEISDTVSDIRTGLVD